MTEWLTTGQMIDKLKVGEVAESEDKKWKAKWSSSKALIFMDSFSDSYVVHLHDKDRKWRILPKYVSFEEAKKAYEYGEIIKCEYVSAIDETKICTQTYKKGTPEYEGALSWYLVTEGKWIIVGESNG